ncbi:MAG: type II toxin-antitoxin system antitoxin SocA domain-containing protein [Cyanobacteria bacterium J06607_10]
MINPLSAAEYFIVRAYEDKTDADMTNMKLQKLLYYAQSLHLALYDEPLFEEDMQAWRYGPVCPSAYDYYCDYASNQLPIPTCETLSDASLGVKKLLEEVWSNFGMHSAYSLRDMTHEELPWKIARGGLPRQASSQEPLSLIEMKKLGRSKLAEIEQIHPVYEPVMERALANALSTKPRENDCIKKENVRDWLESLLD